MFNTNEELPSYVWVDDDFNETPPGWNTDHFNSVQCGINAISPGGTVFVYNGTYNENIGINKPLIVIGENRNTTIIDAGETGDVVCISADRTNISGFTFRNSGMNPGQDAGIHIIANYTTISENNIFNSCAGIYSDSMNTSHNIIADNIISNTYDSGILFYTSNNNIISDNVISDSGWGGIYFVNSFHSCMVLKQQYHLGKHCF
jgi:parallel beta-helix repeat protein